MCGIAGVINHPTTRTAEVIDMIRKIHHRGVDEVGVHDLGPAVLGHARLAVVDLQNGSQPMCNEDGTVWVVFNGEIFNYVELRNDLKAKGYRFKSRCDTEVLVHLWREKGEKMLDDLIGMFAFCIWDTKNHTGMIARDRFGIKPCFITEYGEGLAFASEIKALLALPGMQKDINYNALLQNFSFNYCPPPQTCFKNIVHLEPGHYLQLKAGAPAVKKCYWQWPFYAERSTPDAERFSSLIDDSIRLQMRFDVQGGMYLSGGIDSSVVASHLIKQWNTPKLTAIGLQFSESQYSEFQYSQEVAQQFDINLLPAHIDYTMIPDIAEKVVYQAEQPHGDFSFFLFYILARQAHQQGKIVMMTGDGPDEALFGFNHNVNFFTNNTRTNFSLHSYFDTISYMGDNDKQLLINNDLLRDATHPLDTFEKILEPWRDLDPIEQIIAYECTSLMPGNNLVKGDRMGACWSIEGRAPLMDHRIMELFTRLPITEKMNQGVGKKYLKSYAENAFNKAFIYGKKRMPTTPIGEWLKGPLYGWAHDILSSHKHNVINRQHALQYLSQHKTGKVNHTRQLRLLLMSCLWMNQFFNDCAPVKTTAQSTANIVTEHTH